MHIYKYLFFCSLFSVDVFCSPLGGEMHQSFIVQDLQASIEARDYQGLAVITYLLAACRYFIAHPEEAVFEPLDQLKVYRESLENDIIAALRYVYIKVDAVGDADIDPELWMIGYTFLSDLVALPIRPVSPLHLSYLGLLAYQLWDSMPDAFDEMQYAKTLIGFIHISFIKMVAAHGGAVVVACFDSIATLLDMVCEMGGLTNNTQTVQDFFNLVYATVCAAQVATSEAFIVNIYRYWIGFVAEYVAEPIEV